VILGFDSYDIFRFVLFVFFPSTPIQALFPAAARAGRTVHELRAPAGTQAHNGFLVLLLASLDQDVPVLWISTSPSWYPPGLAWAGVDPARCLFAQGRDDTECLGALEVALRGGMAGVAECKALSRLAARRLALAAKAGGSIGFLLRHAPAFTAEDSTAFATRWLISPAPNGRLRAELLYAKNGRPGVFMIEREEEQHDTASPVVTLVPARAAAWAKRRTG
jgi:protein ImuA